MHVWQQRLLEDRKDRGSRRPVGPGRRPQTGDRQPRDHQLTDLPLRHVPAGASNQNGMMPDPPISGMDYAEVSRGALALCLRVDGMNRRGSCEGQLANVE